MRAQLEQYYYFTILHILLPSQLCFNNINIFFFFHSLFLWFIYLIMNKNIMIKLSNKADILYFILIFFLGKSTFIRFLWCIIFWWNDSRIYDYSNSNQRDDLLFWIKLELFCKNIVKVRVAVNGCVSYFDVKSDNFLDALQYKLYAILFFTRIDSHLPSIINAWQ